jgi:hypothetical protein
MILIVNGVARESIRINNSKKEDGLAFVDASLIL